MPHPTAVILVVGLNRSLLRHTPLLSEYARQGVIHRLKPVLPAVTCSVQASMLTGLTPHEHGIVGNGWYNRELAEVQFWKQSNHLVGGEKVWEIARRRDPTITCANLFWWFNMYSSVDYSVTPRPIYKADGRKLPDCYTEPVELRPQLQEKLGTFPLFHFWGPASSIVSSRWIAEAAKMVYETHRPTLNLVYLPHLDYSLQKYGPANVNETGYTNVVQALHEIDAVVGDLLKFYQERGLRVLVVSEYGIEPVQDAIPLNRFLRENGALRIREEDGLELLDPGASKAFAVADHQVAHLYLKDQNRSVYYAELCRSIPGVEQILNRSAQAALGLNHPRSGDLVLVAEAGRWFSYPYWLDDSKAPDFARTVDIHRKPGYDPLELFLDPAILFPRLTIAGKLLRRKLGFRTLLDVIPLDTRLVKGSHGRIEQAPDVQPIMITRQAHPVWGEELPCTAVRDVILDHLFAD